MIGFLLLRRATLHIPGTGPQQEEEKGHLFIVLTDACAEGDHLLVPVCSEHKRSDRTCLLGVGDHPFIKKPSYVAYALAKRYSGSSLIQRVTEGDVTYRRLLDEKVFARVCAGLMESRLTPMAMKTYFSSTTEIV
jgi:hypothetical protein